MALADILRQSQVDLEKQLQQAELKRQRQKEEEARVVAKRQQEEASRFNPIPTLLGALAGAATGGLATPLLGGLGGSIAGGAASQLASSGKIDLGNLATNVGIGQLTKGLFPQAAPATQASGPTGGNVIQGADRLGLGSIGLSKPTIPDLGTLPTPPAPEPFFRGPEAILGAIKGAAAGFGQKEPVGGALAGLGGGVEAAQKGIDLRAERAKVERDEQDRLRKIAGDDLSNELKIADFQINLLKEQRDAAKEQRDRSKDPLVRRQIEANIKRIEAQTKSIQSRVNTQTGQIKFSPAERQHLSRLDSTEAQVEKLFGLFDEIPKAEGAQSRLLGLIQRGQALAGVAPKISTFIRQRDTLRAAMPRILGEVGNLAKAEQDAAIGLLPDIGMSPEEVALNRSFLKNLLSSVRSSIVQNAHQSALRDISGFLSEPGGIFVPEELLK